jgi:hypothetical protein
MSVDTFLFVLSLMSNRSLTVTGFHRHGGDDDHTRANAYDYYPGILLYNSTVEDIVMAASPGMSFWVPWFSSLFHTDFAQIFEDSRLIQMEGLLYASILYVQPQMARFALDNFGLHALYFVSNFIIRVPKSHFTTAEQVVQTVPRAVCLMGVHLRLQFPGQFYSYSVEQTIRVVVPFLKEIQKTKPTVFGFASDSPFMEAAFKKVFKKNVRVTAAIRAADFDHDSALIDIAFLEMCDDCLLSYRSRREGGPGRTSSRRRRLGFFRSQTLRRARSRCSSIDGTTTTGRLQGGSRSARTPSAQCGSSTSGYSFECVAGALHDGEMCDQVQ